MNVFIADIKDKLATLGPEESWHCAKVLRHKQNDEVELIDGKGLFYRAKLIHVNEKKCEAQITLGPTVQTLRNYYLHLAIAPTKQIDRIEWMLEKAVEIGVDELTFIKCKNSERVVLKEERIRKIIESAVKQSKQARIPKLNNLIDFKEMMNVSGDLKLIAFCDEVVKRDIKTYDFANKSCLICIGPEGDFTKEEVDLANKNSFETISLGLTRLRTETAGLYAVQAISILT